MAARQPEGDGSTPVTSMNGSAPLTADLADTAVEDVEDVAEAETFVPPPTRRTTGREGAEGEEETSDSRFHQFQTM